MRLRSTIAPSAMVLVLGQLFIWPALAQDVAVIADDVAATHLVKRFDPVYPGFARAAGIQGIVKVRLRVAPGGSTEFVDCETGPGFLLQAAQEAAEQFVYRPFQQEGKAIHAEFLADIVFRLPTGTQSHVYRPSPLTGSEFLAQHPSTSLDALPPSIISWITAALAPHLESMPRNERKVRIHDRLGGTTVVAIPTALPGIKLYLFTTRTADECGNHAQCHVRLVEDRGTTIVPIADASANGFAIQPRAGSSYPDIFLSDYGGASHLIIRGYSNIGGEWGQLFCGDILTSGGSDTQNDVHQCR